MDVSLLDYPQAIDSFASYTIPMAVCMQPSNFSFPFGEYALPKVAKESILLRHIERPRLIAKVNMED